MNGINTTLDKGGNGSSKAAQLSVAITYSELLALRNSGTLTPGTWYRITDYTCTTTQDETQSAGHVFDIIVRADDASHLNENAYAAHHEGDTYFQDCKLEAWELKYCIDNDNTRFAWADEDGKGVIFFMKDEWNNQCPYDFKNIMFKRYYVDSGVEGLNEKYVGILDSEQHDIDIPDDGDFIWLYTFSIINEEGTECVADESLNNLDLLFKEYIVPNRCASNVINELQWPTLSDEEEAKFQIKLNNIVISTEIEDGFLKYTDYSNYFGYNCFNNTFYGSCFYNNFKGYCNNNTSAIGLQYNTFGNYCRDNTFGNGFYGNTFGNDCSENTFGNDCGRNSFGNSCQVNTFGNSCYNNTFGNNCSKNTFGNRCQLNTFGNSCDNNTFGNYCENNTIFEGVKYCIIIDSVKNVQILNGTAGTQSSKLTINFATGKNYTQVAGKNTSGTLKIFNPADNA